MSKITLEPNSSGAGTFSIVSPDSNTNRTLNLPDEAGKILSTGNNDPAEVFKQSNILGTVSESGGVPTGAIIERGSNANGEFIKYADGTMICTFIPTTTFSVTNPTGDFGIYRSTSVLQTTYPSAFVFTPSVSGASPTGGGGGGWFPEVAGTPSFWGLRVWGLRQTASNVTVQLIAIGRWY